MSPGGQPGPQPYLAAVTMPRHGVELSQAPLQHYMSPAKLFSLPPQQGFPQSVPCGPSSAREPASAPACIPLQPLQINRQPHYPQYLDPQNPLPRMSLDQFQAKVSLFSKDEVQALFQLMDQALGVCSFRHTGFPSISSQEAVLRFHSTPSTIMKIRKTARTALPNIVIALLGGNLSGPSLTKILPVPPLTSLLLSNTPMRPIIMPMRKAAFRRICPMSTFTARDLEAPVLVKNR
ncbi:hypothetical protein B0H14DRAFT_429139 [Mycena olivaceomarginata]|nr:hypothetical protein B0H14DRAFT_429139 [Mycena olivaceomarginata]